MLIRSIHPKKQKRNSRETFFVFTIFVYLFQRRWNVHLWPAAWNSRQRRQSQLFHRLQLLLTSRSSKISVFNSLSDIWKIPITVKFWSLFYLKKQNKTASIGSFCPARDSRRPPRRQLRNRNITTSYHARKSPPAIRSEQYNLLSNNTSPYLKFKPIRMYIF